MSLPLSRRKMLASMSLGATGLVFSGCVTWPGREEELLPAPSFSERGVVRFLSGIRPYRAGSYRLEVEQAGSKRIIHNYGYGGCGFTLSWGTAEIVQELIESNGVRPPETVGILGAGAVGLATARHLQERGYSVTIYAREQSPKTVSDVAGAQWSPALVAAGDTPEQQARLDRMLASAYRRFTALDPRRYGIVRRENYVEGFDRSSFDLVPKGVLPPERRYDRLPIAGIAHGGRSFSTLLIEPPVYLPRVTQDVFEAGGRILERTFLTPEDLQALPEETLVNCTGIGAKALFRDDAMIPMRGQLVHLEPQALPYLLVHVGGYIFPRSDVVVLGGTHERGVADPVPDDEACLNILKRNREYFQLPRGMLARREGGLSAR